MQKRHVLVVTAASAALAVLALGSPASAKDGDILVRGTCTAGSSAKLKLSEENGRIEVEFEVDQNRNGVPWKVVLRRAGQSVASIAKTTRAPSGSLEARKVIANQAGADLVSARASRKGEVCSARATFPA